MVSTSDKDRRNYQDFISGGPNKSKLSHVSDAKKRHRLTDIQVLQQIDSSEDPQGKSAIRKIDFSNGGGICVGGRKEFQSKTDALKALELSKSKITEIMQKEKEQCFNSFKKSVGRTIKEDHLVSTMPRIRISAAKSQQRNNTFIGTTKRNILPGDAEQMLGSLTHGNLSKIEQSNGGNSRVASAIDEMNIRNNRNSQEDMTSSADGSQPVKVRRNFARGISLQNNNFALKHLQAIAPSAHHRFDKESVHLRTFYRQLYPQMPQSTRNNTNQFTAQASQGSIGAGDYSQKLEKRSGTIGGFGRMRHHERTNSLQLQQSLQQSPRDLARLNTTNNLLYNTPSAVDMNKTNFLHKSRINFSNAASPSKTGMRAMNVGGNQDDFGPAFASNSLFGGNSIFNSNNASQAFVSKIFKEDPETKIITQRLEKNRPMPRIMYRHTESSDEEENEQFLVNPAEDIPRNKLVDKLVRGLQSYIQRMQKRESFRINVQFPFESNWLPAPRECSTLTTVGYKMYLIGGLNYDACKEIICAKINGDQVIWERIPYSSTEAVLGRQCHSSVAYNSKIYTFGGCFMFNKKRQVRECTNQLIEFDTYERRMSQCKTTGFSAGARKNHVATMFKKSMVIYGGQTESGVFYNEMIVCQLDHMEWMKIQLKQGMAPFIQGACCTVISAKKGSAEMTDLNRKSDSVLDGIYYFGGKNAKGELQNKLRYFKPVVIDGKIVHGEFVTMKVQGTPPAARFGHTMNFLPCNSSIIIAGGRNDSMSASNITPFLNDIVLFLLDQKVWLNVKYSVNSERIEYMGNHAMGVVSDYESYEKVLIFGGISNTVDSSVSIEGITSALSNKAFLVTLNCRNANKSLFNKEAPSIAKANSSMKH